MNKYFTNNVKFFTLLLSFILFSTSSVFSQDDCLTSSDFDETLWSLNSVTGANSQVGPYGGGVDQVEALEWSIDGSILYGVDANVFGTINPGTGAFTACGGTIGSGSGAAGTINFSDIDGLSYNLFDGNLYASSRVVGGDDVLLVIDPATCSFKPGFFGGDDYVVITGPGILEDIDDLAFDPADGTLYAPNVITNNAAPSQLVTIDIATGAASIVGALGDDMEGLTFTNDGRLLGVTGTDGATPNSFFTINKSNGATVLTGTFSGGGDFEAITCRIDFEPDCYAGADGLDETLWGFDSSTGANGEVGPFTNGVDQVEAIEFDPTGTFIYAVDGGTFGTIDPATGIMTPCANAIGSANGSAGTVAITDVDGLSLEQSTGILYASHRSTTGNDLLLQLDPSTCSFVPGAFGGADYVEISGAGILPDVDDIAFDPFTGTLYAGNVITNNQAPSQLITINTTTGAAVVVGQLADDMEGLTFTKDGNFLGVTGEDGATPNSIFIIDKTSGSSTLLAPFNGDSDFESVTCIISSTLVCGHLYIDTDGNGVQDVGEPDLANIDVVITDANGSVQTVTSDANGNYCGPVVPGLTTIDVDESDADFPTGFTQTEGDDPTVITAVDGGNDAGNDGYTSDFSIDCYAGADGLDETLWGFDSSTGINTEVGPYTNGVDQVEAIEFDATGTFIYAVDGGTFGTIDPATGIMTPCANAIGSANGSAGTVAITDVDGLSLEQSTGILYASHRSTTGNDLLLQLDPATCSFIPGAFGGDDYVEISGAGILPDVDDIAFDPATGILYAGNVITNNQAPSQLITINIATGAAVVVGQLADDMEGLTFTQDGNLLGVTGEDGATPNSIFTIDKTSGSSALIAPFNGDSDFESVTCRIEFGKICGHLYLDTNGNGMQDPGEPDLANVDVIVTDVNGDMQTVTSDADGNYCAMVEGGSTTIDVDENDPDYPAGSTQTEGTDPTVVTSVPGQTTDGGIDGYYVPAEVSGHLYIDTDGNGMQDPGEPDLANVDVVITDSNGNMQTVTTDANGDWIASVPPGSTTADVDENDPDYPTGSSQTEGTDPTTVTAVAGNNTDAGIDGYFIPAEVSGHLYLDTDGDGMQDPGEPDLANVDVVITDSNGNMQTVSTDANGDWIATVPAGSTTADVDENDPDYPAGSTQTEGTDPTTVTAVAGNNTDAGIDGYYIPADIFGHLYLDDNGNGMQDPGEPDLANVDVIITDSNGNMQTVTSDANGDWAAMVPPGLASADVDETDPDYPTGSTQTEGTDPTTLNAVAGQSTDFGIDGYYNTATVFGHVYFDTDGDGMQDPGEPDLPNIDVVITDSSGAMQTVTTDGNGDWIATVPPGSTTADVDETDPDYPAGSTQTEGTDPTTVNAPIGQSTDAGNDGYYIPADIFGHLYLDTNGDGVQDPGEPDLPNVDVIITDSNGNMQTVTSDANGDWAATVPPGLASANVDETDPDYPTGSIQTEGTDPTTLNAAAGQSTDFGNDGYYNTATVFGHVYFDTDGDGMQDPGEPDLPNIDVVVTDSNGDMQTITTDGNGDWIATVAPGSTTADIDETDPDYPAGSTQTEGTDPTTVNAPVGQSTDAGNDGYYIPADVFGHLYLDTDGDGMQDPGEPDLANVDVIITDSNGTMQTVTSDANGDWAATVPPGLTSADVDETDPDYPTGYTQTEGTDPTVGTAVAGQSTDLGIDGYYNPTSIFGHLYLDVNGDGVQDPGEPDLPNVDVIITDANNNMITVTSDANGDWSSPIPPGPTSSDVDQTDPDFPTFGTPPTPLFQTEGTDVTPINAVAGIANNGGIDGYSISEVCGFVYLDENGNGMQDANEMGIQAVDVIITDSQGNVQTVTTNVAADGSAGEFCAFVPPGTTIVDIDENDPDFPADVTQTEGTDPTTVNAVGFQTNPEEDNGYAPLGDIFGHVYYDDNNNGMQDPGEPDLPNIDVVVTDANGAMQTVATDANGDWSASVVPGTAVADIDENDPDYPAGSVQTEGTDPTTGTAVAGQSIDYGNDGYYIPSDIFGHLYLDSNNNNVQDPGEPDLPNVDVVVTDATGAMQTVTSDANGDWSASVVPGLSVADVDETDPDFPTGSTQTEGTDPTLVTAVLGQSIDAGNDGYYNPGTVNGHIYYDSNNNGMQDAGEPDLANVDVVVTDSNGAQQTITSDANGDYSATVPAGPTVMDISSTDPDFPAGASQTEGVNPSIVTAVAGANTFEENNGYYRCLELDVDVYLEGSLIDNVGSFSYSEPMRTDLNIFRTLPGMTYSDPLFGSFYFPAGQPYNTAPWNYGGNEGAAFDSNNNPAVGDAGYPANVTDWVLVSLRETVNRSSEVCKAAALLQDDGTILFVEPFDCCDATSNEYYIVVEHRNHLLVMTPNPVTVANATLTFDFRTQDSYKSGGLGLGVGQKEVIPGVWAMYGGNGQQTSNSAVTDINVNDKLEWEAFNNLFPVYLYGDFNMSADTNVNDKTLWEDNNSNFSAVPY